MKVIYQKIYSKHYVNGNTVDILFKIKIKEAHYHHYHLA